MKRTYSIVLNMITGLMSATASTFRLALGIGSAMTTITSWWSQATFSIRSLTEASRLLLQERIIRVAPFAARLRCVTLAAPSRNPMLMRNAMSLMRTVAIVSFSLAYFFAWGSWFAARTRGYVSRLCGGGLEHALEGLWVVFGIIWISLHSIFTSTFKTCSVWYVVTVPVPKLWDMGFFLQQINLFNIVSYNNKNLPRGLPWIEMTL